MTVHEALITSGDRVAVPRAVRNEIGLRPGDMIRFIPSGRGFQLRITGTKKSKTARQRAAAPEAR